MDIWFKSLCKCGDLCEFELRGCDILAVAHWGRLLCSVLPKMLTGVSVNWFRSDTVNAVVRIAAGGGGVAL
jgi:hypothetical protein